MRGRSGDNQMSLGFPVEFNDQPTPNITITGQEGAFEITEAEGQFVYYAFAAQDLSFIKQSEEFDISDEHWSPSDLLAFVKALRDHMVRYPGALRIASFEYRV